MRVDGGRRAVSFFFLFLLWTGSKSRPLSASWISLWHRRRKGCWVFDPEETTDDLLKINNENLRQLVWSRLGVFSCWCSGYFQRVDLQAKKNKKVPLLHIHRFRLSDIQQLRLTLTTKWNPSHIQQEIFAECFPFSKLSLATRSQLQASHWLDGGFRGRVWGVGCVYQFNRSVF